MQSEVVSIELMMALYGTSGKVGLVPTDLDSYEEEEEIINRWLCGHL